MRYLEQAMSKRPDISVIGVAGPGEPFSHPEDTLKALSMARERFPDIILCVATNGLNILPYLDALAGLKVSHVTITVNAVDPCVGAKIYSWARYAKKVFRGVEAAALLRDKQLDAIKGLKERNITVKVNTIIIPGVNDSHITEIAKKAAALGADTLNCIPLCPSKGTPFESIEEPQDELVAEIRRQAGVYIPQMYHCRRCRADAAGLLGEPAESGLISLLRESSCTALNPGDERPNIAIATREGVLINQHLGEAGELWVYGLKSGRFEFLESRKAPESGTGVRRWISLAEVFYDCHAILVSGAGDTPQEILKIKGIRVIEAEGIIRDILERIAGGVDPAALEKKTGCNFSCPGGRTGCG